MLCGGEPFVPSDPKLRGGYYMTPCILSKTSIHSFIITIHSEELFPFFVVLQTILFLFIIFLLQHHILLNMTIKVKGDSSLSKYTLWSHQHFHVPVLSFFFIL